MEVAGSPNACGYLGFAPHPSMFNCIGVNAFHSKSRTLTGMFFPPKIPSMSEVMFGCPDSPEPI